MVTREDVEDFLSRLGDVVEGYEEVEEGLWVVSVEGDETKIVVNYAPPVVVLRVNVVVMPEDESEKLKLMTRLLQLNTTELVHGSYGLEGDHVVLTEALELEDLDFSEFQSSFDSITLALASHLPSLAKREEG